MANNSQRGTSERVREKMLKMSEVARTAIDNRAELAERAVTEERQRVQEAERRYFNSLCDHNMTHNNT